VVRTSFAAAVIAIVGVGLGFVVGESLTPSGGGVAANQATSRGYRAPRAADGKPDLSGIWQALNTANWDLQSHPARQGPVIALGAWFSEPAGLSIVEGGEIPYRPEALAKKKQNGDRWLTDDPEVKCYMPGVPRATYQGYPFQIVQTPTAILFGYEFASASRIVRMNTKEESPSDTWMGWSRGHWEDETLVVDVTSQLDRTWLDRAGDYHSDKLHVIERYTRTDPDHLSYEATIDDPQVFTRPWKISMPLYRRVEKNAQLLEFKCVEFVEELMYGHLRKKTE
jgi:hypothetical protein